MGYAGKKDILDFVGRLKEKYAAQLCGGIPLYLSQKITEAFEGLYSDLCEFYNLFQRTYLQMAVDQLRVDMAEIYADVTAILTLQLFPVDYLLSFARSDIYDGRQKNGGGDSGFVHPLSLRIYVVMRAVGGAAQKVLYYDESTASGTLGRGSDYSSSSDIIIINSAGVMTGMTEWVKSLVFLVMIYSTPFRYAVSARMASSKSDTGDVDVFCFSKHKILAEV